MRFLNSKNIVIFLLAVFCVMTLVCCAQSNDSAPDTGDSLSAEAEYEIKLVDAFGNAMKIGAVAQLYQGDAQVGMLAFDADGVAKKTLERGEYSFKLAFTSSEASYYYDQSACVFTASATTADVVLYNTLKDSKQVHAYASADAEETSDCTAYSVSAGAYFAEMKTGRNYLLFTPTVAGTYEFYSDTADVVVGYYGSTHFIQKNNVADTTERGVKVSISASNIGDSGTSSVEYVIGVDVASDCNAIVKIERTGDPEYSTEDEPWTVYEPVFDIKKFELSSSLALKKFDIKASTDQYVLVYNENDGYYHLSSADGPVVLMYLGTNTEYIDSIQKIVDNSNLLKYFYDEDGKFIKKETYAACVKKYIENMDEASGTYPLTKDLMYIISQHGEYVGWWNKESPNFIYEDEGGLPVLGVNYEIAWLSFCCYAE